MEPVGRRNKTVVAASRLHRARRRKEVGRTLIEGPHLLAEALDAHAEIRTVFFLEDDTETRSIVDDRDLVAVMVEEAAMERLAGTRTPRGPIAVVEIRAPSALTAKATLVSWGVSDPGNVGTMIRIAHAFDWGFGYTSGSADPWSPKALRSGSGGQFRLAMTPISSLDDLREVGLAVVAAVVHGGVPPETIAPRPCAVLIGEEAQGLPDHVIAESDVALTIPMPGGAESLNAAVAAGVIVYSMSAAVG